MTYPLARAKLIALVESVTPTSNGLDAHGKFKHDPQQGPESTGRVTRSFYLWAAEGSPRGYVSSTHNPRQMLTTGVHVFYKDAPNNRGLLDEVIEADRLAISNALLDESTWDRTTTGIINVATTGPLILPSTRTAVPGGWESIINVALHYR